MPDGPVPYGAIVGRLNQRAGADYRPSSRATRRLIDARWREGYRLPDFEAVVDAKCSEWAGTEMAKYLRPQTLFGTKFEAYRSQASMDRGGCARWLVRLRVARRRVSRGSPTRRTRRG